jgi:hypothetical protein
MALKRKRSSPTFSSPFSDTSNSSIDSNPLSYFYTQSKPTEPFYYQKPFSSSSSPVRGAEEPSHLNSRTRKRHRDNRPDSSQIYGACKSAWLGTVMEMSSLADVCRYAASTISKLYEAQRQQPRAEPILSSSSGCHASGIVSEQQQQQQPLQKSTLHAFWRIEQQPLPPTAVTERIAAVDSSASLERRCEDCDGALGGAGEDEMAMDLDWGGTDGEQRRCAVCQRSVCDFCSILGQVRTCLACASAR